MPNLSPDIWTKFTLYSEVFTSYISDTYWFANVVDLAIANEVPVSTIGVSWVGAGVGLALATMSSIGSSYCHYQVNLNFQNDNSANNISQAELTPLFDKDNSKLLWYQKLALLGDFVSHIGDYAGPITFVIQLATGDKNPRFGKLITQCGATLFGAFASVSNLRVCSNNIKEMNKKRLEFRKV